MADHLECKVVRGNESYPLTSFFRGTLPHIAQTIFAACQMGGILCKSRGSLPEKPTCQSISRMVSLINGRGRDRLVELVEQGSIGTFQLIDAAGLLLDDDKRRLAVKTVVRTERCRRHGDGSRTGWDGHVIGYTPPPDTFAPSSGCGAFPMFALSGLTIPAMSSSFSLRVTA